MNNLFDLISYKINIYAIYYIVYVIIIPRSTKFPIPGYKIILGTKKANLHEW